MTDWKTYIDILSKQIKIDIFWSKSHCVKSVRIQSFSSTHIPAFGLNTEQYSLSLRIQSECGEIRTRKFPNKNTFHAVTVHWNERADCTPVNKALYHSFPMHPFSTTWTHQKTVKVYYFLRVVGKVCIGNEWVKNMIQWGIGYLSTTNHSRVMEACQWVMLLFSLNKYTNMRKIWKIFCHETCSK